MSDTARNLIQMTVSSVASAGLGTLTLGSAVADYLAFEAGDDGLTFTVTITETGVGQEVNTGCTYTHSGTTLTRGTLEKSTTGAAIAFSSAAIVSVTASADFGRRMESAALTHVAGADSATTMAVGNLYVVDGATLTADRTYTLPATAAVGDRIGVMLSAGSASYEVLITAASGDTLNGVAGGTEWSRLFINGETVVMRCVAANATWVVELDARQKAFCKISRTTAQAITTGTNTKVQCATVVSDSFGMADTTTNYRITVRRGGNYAAEIFTSIGALANQYRTAGRVYKNGALDSSTPTMYISASGSVTGAAQGSFKMPAMAAGDYLEVWVYWDGTTGTKDTGTGGNSCTLTVTEE